MPGGQHEKWVLDKRASDVGKSIWARGVGVGVMRKKGKHGPRGRCPLTSMILEVRRKEKGASRGVLGHQKAEAVGPPGRAHEPHRELT